MSARRWAMPAVVGLMLAGAAPWLIAALAPEAAKPGVVPDDGIQGLYVGTFTPAGEKAETKAEGRVVGQGGGQYRFVFTTAGKGDEGAKAFRVEMTGKLDGDKVAMTGGEWTATLAEKKLVIEGKGPAGGKATGNYTVPKSPTEGENPPAGAVVLLPYEPGKATTMDEWANATWQALPDGSMCKGKGDNRTKKSFSDFRLHVEFRCPYMPAARGQDRGNSGVYLLDRYEVQVLDSFGLDPKPNECGAIYTVSSPKVMASFPPEVWQTYDITVRAPRFGADGKKTAAAVVSVIQNGVTIQENVKVPGPTASAASMQEVPEAPLRLQDHSATVWFRNIWIVPVKDEAGAGK